MQQKTDSSILSYQQHGCDKALLDAVRLTELGFVTTCTVCLLSMINYGPLSNMDFFANWLVFPAVLAAAALVPTFIRNEKFTSLGLNLVRPAYSFKLLSLTCLAVLPLTYVGLLTLSHFAVTSHARAAIKPDDWINWILFQFMYVAVAEEIFFRGYVLGFLLRLKPSLSASKPRQWQATAVVISALVFAISHVIIQGNLLSALTFFPAIIMGFLFLKTRSLLAPILFHAIANVFYVFVL